jgi:hypothetical protein
VIRLHHFGFLGRVPVMQFFATPVLGALGSVRPQARAAFSLAGVTRVRAVSTAS